MFPETCNIRYFKNGNSKRIIFREFYVNKENTENNFDEDTLVIANKVKSV